MLMESLFRCKCNEVGYVELAFQKKTVLKKYLLLKKFVFWKSRPACFEKVHVSNSYTNSEEVATQK